MSKRKGKKSKDDGLDPNSWLTTYSDTITLLLTFFVLLYSFSTVDAMKFKGIASALHNVMTGEGSKPIFDFEMEDGELPINGNPVPTDEYSVDTEEMYESMSDFLKEQGLEEQVQVVEDRRGYIFEVKDKILFESGDAALKKESLHVLDALTKYIERIPNDIIIEGHTDNIPISNYKYKDNWELSAARAYTVTAYFAKTKGLEPSRFYPMFLAEFHPIVGNDSTENRAKNRRVNILIVTDKVTEEGESNGEE